MPVVSLTFDRLKKFIPSASLDDVIEMLPYAALDIEGIEDRVIRVEYNPNRPDFSSDYGIIRALRGLLEIELGTPKFKSAGKSGLSVLVEKQVGPIRPYLLALVARDGALDNETIKQLVAMQEDLHNGVGRRRRKVSIGLHNLDSIRFPVTYKAVRGAYSFVPLGDSTSKSIRQILDQSETGKEYGSILENFDKYPIIVDSAGQTLSLPPIINGQATRVDQKTRNLFVEVTAIDKKAAENILAIIAITLKDAGFKISTVSVRCGGKKIETPQMKSTDIVVDIGYINSVLDLKLDSKKIIKCLRKSRLDARAKGDKIICKIPPYRTDISHPIDIAEEVAIGYGIYNLDPTFPVAIGAGQKNSLSKYFAGIRETLSGLGILESLSFSLTSSEAQYESFGRNSEQVLSVDGSKSAEHRILRDSLIPSLLQSLSRNVHEEYPQKLFEIGKTFHKNKAIIERWHVGVVIAHGEAGYTEIKSSMQALLSFCFGKDAKTAGNPSPFFIHGRSANIFVGDKVVGSIGEILPLALENLKLRVPVAAFEINLTELLGLE